MRRHPRPHPDVVRWWRRLRFDSTALLCGAVLVLSFVAARLPFGFPAACPSVRWFGIECPGCGLTRAFLALARGDVAVAWELHPWAFLLFPLAVWYAVRPLVHTFLSIELQSAETHSPGAKWRTWATTLGMLGFAVWAVARAVNRL